MDPIEHSLAAQRWHTSTITACDSARTHAHSSRSRLMAPSSDAGGGQLLVEFGADIAAKNDEGDTPLLEALMEKRFEVL